MLADHLSRVPVPSGRRFFLTRRWLRAASRLFYAHLYQRSYFLHFGAAGVNAGKFTVGGSIVEV